MRIQNRLLWMTIPLLLVACDMRNGASRSATSEQEAESQSQVGESRSVDGTSYSSAIEGDSVVLTISTCKVPDESSSHVEKVVTEDAHPNVNRSNTLIYPIDEVTTHVETKNSCDVELHIDNMPIDELGSDLLVEKTIEQSPDTLEHVENTTTKCTLAEQPSEQEVVNSSSLDNRLSKQIDAYVSRRGMIHRDATKAIFIPKGQWMLGGQLSWKQWENDNLSYLLLQDLTFSGHTFSVGPYFGYFFAKNMAVGGRFSYNRSYINVGELGLALGEGLSFSLNDFYFLQHAYMSSVFLRSYIPIGESRIFGLFGELQLNHTFSEWKTTIGRDDLLRGVYQHTHALGLGLSGGLSVFLTDFAAAEVMINVGGFDYKWGYQNIKEIDKRDEGHLNRSSADFKINLFSIKFGLTFYL